VFPDRIHLYASLHVRNSQVLDQPLSLVGRRELTFCCAFHAFLRYQSLLRISLPLARYLIMLSGKTTRWSSSSSLNQRPGPNNYSAVLCQTIFLLIILKYQQLDSHTIMFPIMKTIEANFNSTKAADGGCTPPTAPHHQSTRSSRSSPFFEPRNHNIHQTFPPVLLEEDEDCTEDAVSIFVSSQKNACDHRHHYRSSFPWTLHTILEDAELHGFETIVAWLPGHADQFKVHNPDKFAQEVAPLYFKFTQYKSFQRQLNIYGFERIKRGPNTGSYRHPLLMRGNPTICECMTRTKIKGKMQGLKTAPPASSLRLRNKCSLQKESPRRISKKPKHQTGGGKSDIFTLESRHEEQRMLVGNINTFPARKQLVSRLFSDQTSSTDAYTTRSNEATIEARFPLPALPVGESGLASGMSGISLDIADEIINIFGSSGGW
jgi:hypothetical protein